MIVDNADDMDLLFPLAEPGMPPATFTETQRPLIDHFPEILRSQKSLLFTTRSRSIDRDLADGGIDVP